MRALLLILFALLSFPAFSYTDNGDGTVSDPRTGLSWMRCALGQTWAGGTCSGTASAYTWEQAVALTGATTFAGHSDWRLPNIRELQSIVDRSAYGPAIDRAAFPNTPSSSSYFWSGSPVAGSSDSAWYVSFYFGSVSYVYRSGDYQVRLVRGGQSLGLLNLARPTSDYVDQGNGTAAHTPSGLIWKRCAEGQTWSGSTCTGSASIYHFDAAQALSSTFAGQSDWRLPTAEELSSLVDYTTFNCAINTAVFPNTPSWYFWSGSPGAYSSGAAWVVGFYYGVDDYLNRRSDGHVRLVRGGQSLGTFALTLSATGSGSGTLTGSPGGLNCTSTAGTTAGTCSASVASGATVTLTATPISGSTFTGWGGACSGSSATCTLTMDAAKSATASFTSAALSSQTIAFGLAPTVVVGGTGTVSASASSGLPVTFSSTTPGICTVSGSTVTGIAAGICSLAADQAGNSSFSPAAQVMQSFTIDAGAAVPGSPTIISITAGSGSATLNFTAPGNTGGSAISAYTASCTASGQTTRTATSTASPLTVKNLSGGVLYQCTLTATNSGGLTGSASAAQPVTPTSGKSGLRPMLMLLLD